MNFKEYLRQSLLNEQDGGIDPSGGAVMWPRLISDANGVYLWQNEDGSFYVEGRGIQTRPFKSLDDAWEFYRYHVMRRGGEDPGEIPPTIDNPFAQNAPTKQVHQQQVPIRSDVPTSFREAYEAGRRQALSEQGPGWKCVAGIHSRPNSRRRWAIRTRRSLNK